MVFRFQQSDYSVHSPAIDVDNVSVRYGDVTALAHTTLQLESGTVCGLIGMNGSGKSTLFKTIMALVTPDSGRVLVQGMTPERARRTGAITYVPQAEAVDWSFPISVRDVVMTGRYGYMGITRRPRKGDHLAVDDALDRVELGDLQRRQIGELSGGQRKRVFVARGIAQQANILLLDEPFAGVDKRSEATISALLRELAAAGATILVSTHDLQGLNKLVDQAVLVANRIIAQGSPEFVTEPENLVRAFGVDPLAPEQLIHTQDR